MKEKLLLSGYNRRGMGIHFYVPFAAVVFCAGIILLFAFRGAITVEFVCFAANYILGPVSAWHVIFLYQPIFEEEGGEFVRSLPGYEKMVSPMRMIPFLAGYWLCVMGMIFCVFELIGFQNIEWLMILKICALSFFFSAMAYFAMAVWKNAGTVIGSVVSYVLLCAFLGDKIPFWMNMFMMTDDGNFLLIGAVLAAGMILTLSGRERAERDRGWAHRKY